jgi:hypothetical protein
MLHDFDRDNPFCWDEKSTKGAEFF